QHGGADFGEIIVGQIGVQIGTEVIGAQAPATPLFIDAARQGESGPATTRWNVALEREHERTMHAPEPPREIFEWRAFPAPVADRSRDLHVCTGEPVIAEQPDKLSADAVSEGDHGQTLRA